MYSRNEIINMVHENIEEVYGFYQHQIINITGETSDTSELINEVITEA